MGARHNEPRKGIMLCFCSHCLHHSGPFCFKAYRADVVVGVLGVQSYGLEATAGVSRQQVLAACMECAWQPGGSNPKRDVFVRFLVAKVRGGGVK